MKLKPLKQNKKGQSFFDIIIFMVIIFFMVLGFVIFKFVMHTATNNVVSIVTPANSVVNITDTFNQTFGYFDTGLNSLRYVAWAIIFGMICNILLSNFLVRNHPAFFFMYIGITVLAIILSVFISNSAETLINNSILGSTFTQNFPEGTFVLQYLPIWVAVIGLFGGVILYLGIIRDRDTGGF